jgi:hypothetical protein
VARRRSDAGQAQLRFRGAPLGLETLAPPALLESGPAGGVTLKLPGEVARLAPAPLQIAPVGSSAAYLRFSLPETTPPGSYSGTAEVGGVEFPVVAEVEAHLSLRIAPTMLTVAAAPGATVDAHVTALNDGNVAFEIRSAYAFGLFDQEGIEAAFGAGFRDETAKGERRFDRFVETLADHHELARLQVSEGGGPLQPGEVRALALSLRLPDGLEPGRTYQGTWTLYTVGYTVRVAVADERPTRRRRAG